MQAVERGEHATEWQVEKIGHVIAVRRPDRVDFPCHNRQVKEDLATEDVIGIRGESCNRRAALVFPTLEDCRPIALRNIQNVQRSIEHLIPSSVR